MMHSIIASIVRQVILLSFILSFFYRESSYGQTIPKGTDLLIIGTVHSGNPKVTYQSLYRVLTSFQPDLVLWEMDDDFKPVFGLLTAYRLKIAKPPMEQLALQKFNRNNKVIPILGFDTIINPRKAYIKKMVTIYDQFHEKMYRAKMDKEDSLQYASYVEKENEYLDLCMNGTLEKINTELVFRKKALIQDLEDKNILLAQKYLSDTTLIDAYKADLHFWKVRNDHMVNKIVSIANEKQAKRVAVITGVSHKYYLAEKLKLK